MGERKQKPKLPPSGARQEGPQSQVVGTLGGRIHVRWDEGTVATPHGQLVLFAKFLGATGVFEPWVSLGCNHESPAAAGRSGQGGQSCRADHAVPDAHALQDQHAQIVDRQYPCGFAARRSTAEQFKAADPWAVLVCYVSDRIAPTLRPFRPPGPLAASG